MIVTNLGKKKNQLWQDAKKHLWKFTKLFIINNILNITFGFLCFYLEHCYDVQKETESFSMQRCLDVCRKVQAINNSSVQNIESLVNLSRDCQQLDYCGKRKTSVECVISEKTVLKWYEYSFTIGSTIGYGHLVTRSFAGKLSTMCYAVISIPLTTVNYYFFGCFLMNVIKTSIILVEQKVLKHHQVTMFQRKTVLVQTILTLGVVFLHATLFYELGCLGSKDYFDSVYFTFISYTTVGFGDIVFDWDVIIAQGRESYVPFSAASMTIFSFGFSLIASLLTMLANVKFPKPKGKKERNKVNNTKNSNEVVLNQHTKINAW